MKKADNLNVIPALVENGGFQGLVDEGQTISLAQSPLNGSLALFISANQLVNHSD